MRSPSVIFVSYFPFKYGFKSVHIPVLTRIHFKKRCVLFIIHHFFEKEREKVKKNIALFSALEQTHCAHWHVILNE